MLVIKFHMQKTEERKLKKKRKTNLDILKRSDKSPE